MIDNRKELSDIFRQFGNLIALTKGSEDVQLGIPSVFVSSLVQLQPLFEIDLYLNGRKLEIELMEQQESSMEWYSRFSVPEVNSFIEQRVVVDDDQIALRLDANGDGIASLREFEIFLSGCLLFSPQGIPYHWKKEAEVTFRAQDRKLSMLWRDLLMSIHFPSIPSFISLVKLNEDDILQEKYFETFNAKPRYRYWVTRKVREKLFSSRVQQINPYQSLSARNAAYLAKIPWVLRKDSSLEFHFSVSYRDSNNDRLCKTFLDLRNHKFDKWNSFTKKVPHFQSSEEDLESSYYRSWFVLFSNRMDIRSDRFKYPFTSVNKFHYYNQFFWDSAFHALSWIWYNDPEPSESELKNFVVNQWRCGMVPYELFIFEVNGREWMETDYKTTAATQPPVIGISLEQIYKKFGNKDLLVFFYKPLVRYERWLSHFRDVDNSGMAYCYHIWETGCDNSPVWDSVLRGRLLDPPVYDVGFNAYLQYLRKTLLNVALELQTQPIDEIRERLERANVFMNEVMLDPEDAFYYSVIAGTTKRIKIKSINSLIPLILDFSDNSLYKSIVESYVLSESHFFTPCPLPSVSFSEPSFESHNFWRGANWPQMTWTVIYGLKRQGFFEAASGILDRFLSKTISNNLCNEYYDSFDGSPVGLPFQGWGTLFIDLILRHVVGVEPVKNGFAFLPLNTRYKNWKLENLLMGDTVFSVERLNEKIILSLNGREALQLNFGTPVVFTKNQHKWKAKISRADLANIDLVDEGLLELNSEEQLDVLRILKSW
ncbi:MAG: hypothetical protein PWP37_1750 [Thermotogota bacterium]|nr:hypothetical protein [Thermotogota bacterium]